MKQKKALGTGLDALLGDVPGVHQTAIAKYSPGQQENVALVSDICPDPNQPRRIFDKDELAQLANSIKQQGLLQPVLVRKTQGDTPSRYRIVAGERRWRAAQLAEIHEIPVIIRDFTDSQAAEIALIENIQRVDLNPIEEANAYMRLVQEHKRSHTQIAQSVGKSRSHIANLLRLLQLPEEVQTMVTRGMLTMGHARALLGTQNTLKLAHQIVKQGLSVRQIEAIVQKLKVPASRERIARTTSENSEGSADIHALERDISEALGASVEISHNGKKGGVLRLQYYDLDQLDEICRRLMGTAI